MLALYAGLSLCDYHNYRVTDGFAELSNRIYCQTRDITQLTLIPFLERKGHLYQGRTFPGGR